MDLLKSLLGFFDVEIVLAGVASEVVEDLSLLLFGDPALFGGASHGSAAFSFVDLSAVVSVNCLEDVLDFEAFRDIIGDGRAVEERLFALFLWCNLVVKVLTDFLGSFLGFQDT